MYSVKRPSITFTSVSHFLILLCPPVSKYLWTDFQICFEMFHDNETWKHSIQNESLLPNLTWFLFWLVKNATSLSYQKYRKNLPTIFASSGNKLLTGQTTNGPNTWNEKFKPMLRNGKYHDIVNRAWTSVTDWSGFKWAVHTVIN